MTFIGKKSKASATIANLTVDITTDALIHSCSTEPTLFTCSSQIIRESTEIESLFVTLHGYNYHQYSLRLGHTWLI